MALSSWASWEENFLTENFVLMGAAWCSNQLPERTVKAVQKRACLLRLNPHRICLRNPFDGKLARHEVGFRKCLGCFRQFVSEGCWNRKCPICNNSEAEPDGSKDFLTAHNAGHLTRVHVHDLDILTTLED